MGRGTVATPLQCHWVASLLRDNPLHRGEQARRQPRSGSRQTSGNPREEELSRVPLRRLHSLGETRGFAALREHRIFSANFAKSPPRPLFGAATRSSNPAAIGLRTRLLKHGCWNGETRNRLRSDRGSARCSRECGRAMDDARRHSSSVHDAVALRHPTNGFASRSVAAHRTHATQLATRF